MSSRTAADAQAVALRRVSQVPRPFCPRALSPFTPEGPIGARTRCFPIDGRLQHLRQTGHLHLCNEADSGSLALRLAGSPPEASPAGLLRRTLGWLPVERAINRVTSFQVTRTARLVLAHRRHKEHQENLEGMASGQWISQSISDEVSDFSSELCSSLICLGDLGVLVV